MRSSIESALVRQPSFSLSEHRLSRSDEGSSSGSITSGGHQVKVSDKSIPLEMHSSGEILDLDGPGRVRSDSVVHLDGPPPKLAHGLKLLFDERYQKPEYELEKSGVRFGDSDKGKQIGGYIVVKDKDKGVEPGFLAKKAWMPKDEANMLQNPGHKFFQRAHALLDSRLAADLRTEGPLAAKAQSYVWENHRDAFINHEAPDGFPSTLEEFLSDPANNTIRDGVLDHLKSTSPEIRDELRKDVMANEKKFNKLHMIKLDYVETDMTTKKGEIHVRIPSDKQKFPLHREFTAQTRDSANRSAVRETMANDLMSALGVHSQKLKLLPTEYADGHPKLLLDGTFATGPQGGRFSDFDGHLEDGFIVQLGPDKKPLKDANGHFKLDTSINQLGRNKIHMLAMADRDALGSSGGNKGFADNTFIGIDPGHALEENLLGRTGDVRSDFSFDQPSKIEKRGYKNFTIFDQQPLSEKMEGVRKMKELRDSGADVAIFDDYADKFDGTHNPQLNFADEINGMKTGWIQRRDDILGVFAERLAVDDFEFQKGASPDRQKELANKTLDILDNLEKLTSKTSDLSFKGKVQLERPRVTERREWHVGQSDLGVITMSFTGNSKQAGKVNADLMKFINETPALKEAMDQGMFTVKREGGKVSFEIPPESGGAHFLETVAAHFTNQAVMQHKHG